MDACVCVCVPFSANVCFFHNTSALSDNLFIFTLGVIGGSLFDHPGGAVDALCLPFNPVLENNPGASYVSNTYGAELEVQPLPKHNFDPLCAVSRSPRATILMVPAANACHPGWTMEHSGDLMAGHLTLNKAASEYICVDKQDTQIGSSRDDNCKVFL
ncbi:hypothetical protein C0Q70_15529 [Pomacea canaliculata]|uniref:Uncharacterized protein n=1 Tax=Pomacea canaliculata TaxID=400727 RepID=A0A2T7NV44_POMCA|nr:hypothetical protein C0Q70_15529 [Pomacea canaliculata]